MILSKEINTFEYVSELNITIKGTGKQTILSSHSGCDSENGIFNSLPDQILVNGVPQNSIQRYVNNLVNQTNIITMRWNYQLTDCHSLLAELTNIISIDLSNFDTSKVQTFGCMFL